MTMMQMSELMMSLPHNFPCILYTYKMLKIFMFLLKHVNACPNIKTYQSKHYSAFIQSVYKESFTFLCR